MSQVNQTGQDMEISFRQIHFLLFLKKDQNTKKKSLQSLEHASLPPHITMELEVT
jgi:hypothetical protein